MQRECTKVYRHWRGGCQDSYCFKIPPILFCTRCADPRWPRKHGELLPSFVFFFSFQFCPSFFIHLMCSSSENWCLCPALLSWEHTGRGHLGVSIRARDRDKASGNQENPLEVLEWKVQIMTIWTVLQRLLGFQLFQRLQTALFDSGMELPSAPVSRSHSFICTYLPIPYPFWTQVEVKSLKAKSLPARQKYLSSLPSFHNMPVKDPREQIDRASLLFSS